MFNPANAILIIADTPERIRKCDLDRLFNTFWGDEQRVSALRQYVGQHRPDLCDECDAVIADLTAEYA